MSVLQEAGGIPDTEPKSDIVQSFNLWQKEDIKRLKKLNMKDNKPFWDWGKIVDVAFILGIVILAALGKDGWGWLVFLFFIKNI
jgi:hypothetical protein